MTAIEIAETLRDRFTGEVILPGHGAYDTARRGGAALKVLVTFDGGHDDGRDAE